jgi:CRP/FNR family nitrogen fixation transcriptional regulator
MTAPLISSTIHAGAQPLPSDGLADVMSQMGLRTTYARDEEIFGQDEETNLVYRVIDGVVRTTRLMADGRRQIGDFYFAGQVFGLECGQTRRFSAEALGDCTIEVMRRSTLESLAETDPGIEPMMMQAIARELDRAQDHVLLLGRKTACERVASLLLEVAGRNGEDEADLPMTRQDMADYLGLTIETVSRMLSQLQSKAVIRFRGLRTFEVCNSRALLRMAG